MVSKNISKILFCVFLLGVSSIYAQSINFGASGLVGDNLNNPTSIDFGPNQKLYVAQQDGVIWEYEIERDDAAAGSGSYSIINSVAITQVKINTPNHNDDGTASTSTKRQITGILTSGTSSNPILYVTSSDNRIGGGGVPGNDSNLDTNSGVLSRLTWNGSNWDKVDLVRGLPRCEENHSTNGLELFTLNGNTYLLIQQGGNTNQGAPSNNFAGTSETYMAGALLIVNLTQLEQIETNNGGPFTDFRDGNTKYVYDLPTTNDPEREDIDNTHPSFPYGPSHPLYNATIDIGDPFGGNNGLNQAFPEAGGPVQIFSPGYRNAYDVVVTSNGKIFTGDNGSNGGWGGAPLIYDSNDQLKGTHHTTTYDPLAGDYVTGEFNIENGRTDGDALHYVGSINDVMGTYYGGHPVPIRAFPSKAKVYKYQYNGSNWVDVGSYNWADLISGVSGYFNSSFNMTDFPDDPRQGEYLSDAISSPKVNILDIVSSSTNGMCIYTASNFGSSLLGDILTASFNGDINRYKVDATNNGLILKDNGFLSGFGSIPLDIIAQGDADPFPGTIWAATYGSDNITVFEPVDFGECILEGDPGFDPFADYDGDGYTNQDELDNGTNHCSAGSSPNDNDADFISDLNDPDDDNDGIADNQDVFAIDPQNGLTTNLPINYPFWNNDPGTGFFGLGFTGLILDPTGNTDYLTQFDETNLSFGGAGGKATVDAITSGDALTTLNSQQNAFQFGINVDSSTPSFTVHGKLETPFNGSQPLNGQSYGIFVGNGDQDNYFKVVIMDGLVSGDATDGIEVLLEENGSISSVKYDAPGLIQAGGVDIYISINPNNNDAQAFYSLNDGEDIISLGNPVQLPLSFLDPNDNGGLAVGIIGTSGNSGSTYIATWDFINITEDQPSALAINPVALDFGSKEINSSSSQDNLQVINIGGPAEGAIDITELNITGLNAGLFQSTLPLPLKIGAGAEKLIPITFIPNGVSGAKSADLEIIHTGDNSPLIVPLSATLTDPIQNVPIVRISAGSSSLVSATDGGPNWEATVTNGSYTGSSFSVNEGTNQGTNFSYTNRHSSIPAYIDQATFDGIFDLERWDPPTDEEMEFTIPLVNGDYVVNLFVGNNFSATSQPGQRIYDVLIEGNIVEDNLDLAAAFGHKVGAMVSYNVTVNDGVLNIAFGHEVQNPLVNAIEILGSATASNQPPVAIASATPPSGEAPLEVTFTGSNSTDDTAIVSYAWDFADGNTSNLPDPVHTFNTTGTYLVSLTVTDEEDLTDTTTLSIEVSEPVGNQPPVAIASATPLSGELPLEVTFIGSNSTDDTAIVSYAWDFTDGNTSDLPDPVYTFDTAGTYLVSLTVTDGEGLTDTTTLSIEVSENLPPSLTLNTTTIDFGQLPINSSQVVFDLDAFNDGGTGENISITALNITGTHAAMFTQSTTLPLNIDPQTSQLIPISFTPDAVTGVKTASLEIVHTGDNSPLIVQLSATLTDPTQNEPIVRISAGSSTTVIATDGGPNWEATVTNGSYTGTSFSVNEGRNQGTSFLYSNRHSSIPAYIDQATFDGIFDLERWDGAAGAEMEFTIPLANGDYTVNLFVGNNFSGTSQPGQRIYDVLIEGNIVEDNLDLAAAFGHKVGAMLTYSATVNDGVLNIAFGHEVENPLINAIEIVSSGPTTNQPPVAIASATPLSGELPLEVTFIGSNSTDDTAIVSYAWDFTDGNTSDLPDPVYTFDTAGTYLVSLTVTDGEGLTDTTTLSIEVSENLPPSLTLNTTTIDFGQLPINSSQVVFDLDAFNDGGTGENISITALNITGTHAAMFTQSTTLPLNIDPQTSQLIPISFTPDAVTGVKTASLEIVHTGDNSPLIVQLSAETIEFPPISLATVSDQFNQVGEMSTLTIAASGGDPNENMTYSIINQPAGLDIEPTNGQIIGIIDFSALNGGPNNDGVHLVTVTASKPGSTEDTEQFTWVITEDSSEVWNDKVENENYTARHECSFVQAGDKFYLFGGRENAQTLDIYDYTTDTWNSLVNSAPIEFNHFQAVEYQGLIWVIGAFKTNNFPTEVPADFIWAFNPGTQEWIQGPEIPANRKRGSAGLVVYNDKFYVLAGNTIGHSGGYVPWFDEYDPATGTWTELEDAPRPRDHFHAAVINGKLYAASGRLSGGEGGVFGPVISEVDVYDFATQSWVPGAQNVPTPRAAAVVANFENKLVVAGGEAPGSTDAFAITEIYDPVTQSWSNGADLVHQRHGTQGIVSGQGIFVVGGSPNRGGGNQKNMEYYGQDNPTGNPSVVSALNTDNTVQFAIGETKNTALSLSNGNVGIIVTSMTLSGPDALEFNIDTGNYDNSFLVKSNSQHEVTISHNGTQDNKTAELIINYNNTDTRVINLSVNGSNQAPIAIASATPPSGEAPLEVTFTGSNSTDDTAIVSYAWDFADGNTSNLPDPVHTFNTTGTYLVSLTVTDEEDLTDTTTLSIEVSEPVGNQPPVAIASATPLSGELPLEVTFIGSNSSDDTAIVSYAWDFTDGNTSDLPDPVYTFDTAGTYLVSLTVTDGEGLTDTTTLSIEVSENLPPSLTLNTTTIDFGQLPINSSQVVFDLDVFNDGGTGENISITALNITGTHAAMFTQSTTLPLNIDPQTSQLIPISFTPDAVTGVKTASLEIVHTGDNSPLIVQLSATLTDPTQNEPIVRISAGSSTTVIATDGGPNWEATVTNGSYTGTSFSVNEGTNQGTTFLYSNRHSSIPAYIDQATFDGIFDLERWDGASGAEMEFTIPLANGDYTVNLFVGNNFSSTRLPGQRIYDVLIEGNIVEDNLDLAAAFGHKVGAMISYNVTVNDGVLNIAFGHEVQNPLVNAIEIIGASGGGMFSKTNKSNISLKLGDIYNLITISPNPADQETYIKIPNELSITGEAFIFSIDGRLVRSFSLGNLSNEVFSIPTYSLEEGLYILTIPLKDGSMNRQKLIVAH